MHARTGIDYFAFNAGLFNEIPPFAIGRTAWDNWLLYAGIRSGAKLIDASNLIMCIHQNHDWSHIKGGEKEAWEGKEAINNWKLTNGKIYTLDDANYILTSHGLRKVVIKRIIKYFNNVKNTFYRYICRTLLNI
jgi:flavin-dependent dehydrogenase